MAAKSLSFGTTSKNSCCVVSFERRAKVSGLQFSIQATPHRKDGGNLFGDQKTPVRFYVLLTKVSISMSRSTAQHRGETPGCETSLKVTHIRVEDVTDNTQLIELSQEICFNQYMQIYGAGHAETNSPQQLWGDAALSGKVEWLKTLMAFDVSTNPVTPLATCNFKIGSLCKRVNVRLDFQRYLKTRNGVELKSLAETGLLPVLKSVLLLRVTQFVPCQTRCLETWNPIEEPIDDSARLTAAGVG